MPRGDYRQTIRCADRPCPEKITYHHQTRADEAASVKSQRESPWKCSRHLYPEKVLGPGRETLAGVMTVTPRPEAQSWEPPAIWAGPGFPFVSDEISGPGFRAFAGDWPEGTRLEITARILPPGGGSLTAGTATCTGDVDDEEEGVHDCGKLSRYVVARSDGDKTFGAGGGTEEACEEHLADAVSGMADGDENVQAVVAIRWTEYVAAAAAGEEESRHGAQD